MPGVYRGYWCADDDTCDEEEDEDDEESSLFGTTENDQE